MDPMYSEKYIQFQYKFKQIDAIIYNAKFVDWHQLVLKFVIYFTYFII